MKKEYGYPTLKVICQASAGNETAIREILKFYDAYIVIQHPWCSKSFLYQSN